MRALCDELPLESDAVDAALVASQRLVEVLQRTQPALQPRRRQADPHLVRVRVRITVGLGLGLGLGLG